MPNRTCSFQGCGKPHAARGWCSTHYARWSKHGDPNYVRPEIEKPLCSVDECVEISIARGWCGTHYARWSRWGNPLGSAPPRPGRLPCTVEGCDKESCALGLCQGHYVRQKKHGPESIIAPLRSVYRTTDICEVDGCNSKARGRNWCFKHWKRWRRTGDPEGLVVLGVQDHSSAQVYIIQHHELNAGKVGLAGCGGTRLQEHIARGWEALWVSQIMLRSEAAGLESLLLGITKTRGYLSPADIPQRGWTETFDASELPNVLAQTRRLARRATPLWN